MKKISMVAVLVGLSVMSARAAARRELPTMAEFKGALADIPVPPPQRTSVQGNEDAQGSGAAAAAHSGPFADDATAKEKILLITRMCRAEGIRTRINYDHCVEKSMPAIARQGVDFMDHVCDVHKNRFMNDASNRFMTQMCLDFLADESGIEGIKEKIARCPGGHMIWNSPKEERAEIDCMIHLLKENISSVPKTDDGVRR